MAFDPGFPAISHVDASARGAPSSPHQLADAAAACDLVLMVGAAHSGPIPPRASFLTSHLSAPREWWRDGLGSRGSNAVGDALKRTRQGPAGPTRCVSPAAGAWFFTPASAASYPHSAGRPRPRFPQQPSHA